MNVVWPEYISLRDWSSRLIADFTEEQLPLLDKEEDWEEWATTVASMGIFERAGVPVPTEIQQGQQESLFPSWQDWAKIVYQQVFETQYTEQVRAP